MNNSQINSEKETLNWLTDTLYALGKPELLKCISVRKLYSSAVPAASFMAILLALGFATVNHADWSDAEEDGDQPFTEQFINEDDDSGIPEPAPDEPDLDEMEDQGELEGYDPEEAD
ncbi:MULTISPECIES: hypothetical protein [unclassified Endozoicomonas]|uniref:hypothetical protein n=1 Tax=unclassified Endozoicomonas TaxID=2644528 RepID=UPI0021474372|nr:MULTISPECIES: hypothetical protein [unclassified Endozoicomonas]